MICCKVRCLEVTLVPMTSLRMTDAIDNDKKTWGLKTPPNPRDERTRTRAHIHYAMDFALKKSLPPYIEREDFRKRHADLFRLRAQFASGAKQGSNLLLLPSKLFLH